MKRLTIGVQACTETLALLVAVAWADGRLEDSEKDGVRGAAQVLNLTKDSRDRLEKMLAEPVSLDGLRLATLTAREKAFAYVAASWMAHADGKLDDAEKALLARIGDGLGLSAEKQAELGPIALSLEPLPSGARSWSQEITRLFKQIPPQLEEPGEEFEVVFE